MNADVRIPLIFTILGLALFSQLLKSIASPIINLLIDLCVVVAFSLSLNSIRISGLVSKAVIIMGIYVLCHFLWQLFTYGYAPSYNYNFYRNMLRGCLFFFVVKTTLDTNSPRNDRLIVRALSLIYIIIVADVIIEWFLLKIIGISLVGFLPWVVLNDDGSTPPFGMFESNRIPTLLGTPYAFSAVSVSLIFFFLHRLSNRINATTNKLLGILCLLVIFLTDSRFQTLILVFGIVVLIVKGRHFSGRLMRACSYLGISLVAMVTVLSTADSWRFTTNPVVLEAFRQGYFWSYLPEFLVLPEVSEVFYLLVGKGGVTGFQQYAGLFSLFGVEAGLFEEMLQIYGLFFIFFYYFLLFAVYSRIRSNAIELKLCLLVYFLSPLHFWTVPATFHVEYFFLLLALLTPRRITRVRGEKNLQGSNKETLMKYAHDATIRE